MLKRTLQLSLTICALASLAISQPAYAQISEFELTASDGAAGDVFGYSVSISGDYAVVGAYSDDDNGDASGSAYVFKRSGTSWAQEAKLLASDGAAGDLFGISVSISGDYVIVGARDHDDNGSNSGSAYIFKRSGTSWTQEAILLPSDGAAGDAFGISVSISGDYAVIGAHLDDDNGTDAGSAYVFKRTGTSWAQEAKMLPSDGTSFDLFGASISISGDYIVVGSVQEDDNGTDAGSAYVFKRTGTSWTQEAKLLASDGAADDAFGTSVSISGDYAISGARAHDDNGDASGSAYVFKRSGTSWAQEAKLLASDGAAGDLFGISVSISGDYAVIGAHLDDDNGTDAGSAYVFKRTGTSWAQEAKMLPSDGTSFDLFGASISISGGYAVVGAWKLGVASSAYVYNGFIPSSNFTFDMDGSTILFLPNVAAGYDVSPSSFSFDAVLGTNIGADDDSNTELIFSAGFSFPYFGTTWSRIQIGSNGIVTFGDIGNSGFFIRNNFYPELPMIAAFWGDLDPTAGGGVFFKEEASKFTVTWSNIPEFDTFNSNTIQLVLFNDGYFQITYNGVDVVTPDDDGLTVGFNSGITNRLTQSVDFINLPINGGPNDMLFELFGPGGTDSHINLSTNSLLFGNVQVGSSKSFQLSIVNTGGAALDISNITVSNSQFSVASPTSFQVAAGASINKTVTFNPTSIGVKSGSLTITSNDLNLPSATVDLSGTGTVTQISEFNITASDGAADDQFGRSVSISGDYAVVGAHADDDNGDRSGSAYIYKRSGATWTQEVKLLPSDGAAQDNFGISVSISGDYAVVGAYSDNDNGSLSGSAYVFKRTGTSWAQEAKLLASDGAANEHFGISVSIFGDYAVVGARLGDGNGTGSGAAYVFKRTGTSWAQEAKLLASDGAADDLFGESVSISGDYAVIGARGDDDNGSLSGSAYVFKRTGTSWAQEAKLLPSDVAVDDQFGISVSISGDYTVVGADLDDDNGSESGSAYVFKRTGTSWAQEAKLVPSDGAVDDQFGISVSISGDYAVVGAWFDDDNGANSGSAYLYNVFSSSPTASISLSPSPLNFGDVQVGNSTSLDLTITNNGGTALDVTNITSSDNQFTVASPTSFQVSANSTEIKTVTFAPTTTGLKNGTLTVTSNASNLPTATVDLSGTGIESTGDLQNPTVQINSSTSTSVPLGGTATVSVTATDNVGVSIAELKWRRGGDEAYTVTTMSSIGNNVYESSITNITTKGVQWFVDATDASENFGTTGEQNISAELSTTNFSSSTISGSAYPSGFPSGVWRLISVPADLTNSGINSVLSELGSSGPETWRIFRWVNGRFSEATGSFDPGNAFWLQQRVLNRITIKPGSGTTTANTDFTKSLSPGWNLIGNPFAYPVKWTNANTNIRGPITYTDASGYLPVERYLQPWTGYWVRNNSLTNQTLTIEPILHTGTVRNLGKSVQIDPLENLETTRIVENGGWFVNISLTTEIYGDQFNYIGAVENAKDGYDKYDSRELPRMGDYVNLYFPHEDWGQYSANYTSDMRSAQQQGYTWDFEVKTNLSKEEMQIDIQNIEMAPAGMEVVLIDLDFRIAQDIRKSSIYRYFSGTSEDPKRFKLLIGESGYIGENNDGISVIPNTYSLSQNFPNPFNPTTTFTYSLPEAVHVNIQIYNILGERMATLVNEQMNAGSHMIRWNAGNIATGVYFYRIQAGNYHAVKKMVFIK